MTDEKEIKDPQKPDSTPPDSTILERVEGLRKGLETFLKEGKLLAAARELKLPTEIAHQVVGQIDDTKRAILEKVSNELRDYLQKIDLSDELKKVLSEFSLEITTKIDFVPREKKPTKKARKDATPKSDSTD